MADRNKDSRQCKSGGTKVAIRVGIVAVDRVGNYCADAEGFSLKSKYPINRMAKVLFDAGYRGRMETYGPAADGKYIILRHIGDIEKMAAHRLTETSKEGFRFVPWTRKSLAALRIAPKPNPSSNDGVERAPPVGILAGDKRRSWSEGHPPASPDTVSAKTGRPSTGAAEPSKKNAPARVGARNRSEILTLPSVKFRRISDTMKVRLKTNNINDLPLRGSARQRELRTLPLPLRLLALKYRLDGTTARLVASLAGMADGGSHD